MAKSKDSFDKAPLTGTHRVSPCGKHLFIGGHKFKRTVLPSLAEMHLQQDKAEEDALEALETDGQSSISEVEGEAN